MQRLPFPRHLDLPNQFLFWSFDVVAVFLTITIIGLLQDHMLPAMIVGAALTSVYRRYRDRHPDGYLRHLLYWYGFVPFKGRAHLNPFERRVLP